MTDKYTAYPSLRLYDRLGVPYVLFDGPWDGPLWTGHCMMLSTRDGYGDQAFAHELFHWIAATPKQRTFPDFALGRQVNADMDIFTSSSTKHLFDNTKPRKRQPGSTKAKKDRNDGWGETTISLDKAEKQEGAACNAMFLYAPLTGLTSWDAPTFDHTACAADFAGMEYPGSDHWNTAKVAKRVTPIVQAIDPSVSADTVTNYLRALNDMGTDERFS